MIYSQFTTTFISTLKDSKFKHLRWGLKIGVLGVLSSWELRQYTGVLSSLYSWDSSTGPHRPSETEVTSSCEFRLHRGSWWE